MRAFACNLALLSAILIGACASAPAAHADYKAITQPMLLPLGGLIVAVRGKTPTTDYWMAQFNTSADGVLKAIDGDTSDTATRLRNGIANVRANPNDLQTLEDTRSTFLSIT